jgi:hypothetical protein
LTDFAADNVMALTIALGLIFAFFGSPICALVDSAVLKLLGDQKILYGTYAFNHSGLVSFLTKQYRKPALVGFRVKWCKFIPCWSFDIQ